MNHVILLINHIHFPYKVFEQSLDWASKNGLPLKTIFLTTEPIRSKINTNYVFDVDLPHAALTAGMRINRTEHIIEEFHRFIEQRAETCNVFSSTYILASPTFEQLAEKIQNAAQVFIGFGKNELPRQFDFGWKDLMAATRRKLASFYIVQ